MLVVNTTVAPSTIHGIGLYSTEFIPSGSVVWQWHNLVDREVSSEAVNAMPIACQEFFKRYGWVKNGRYILCIDNEKFINHSDEPNCVFTHDGTMAVARKDIHVGEEITQDYRQFDDNFGLKEFGYDW